MKFLFALFLAVIVHGPVSAPTSFLINEDCEGTGTPPGWTDTNTPDWDNTTTPLDGAQSLWIHNSFSESWKAFTGQTTVYYKGLIRFVSGASAADKDGVSLRDSSGTVLASLHHDDATFANHINIKLYANGASGSASSITLALNTTYYVWLTYVSGGTCELAISTTNSKPAGPDGTGGNVYLTKTGSAATAARLYIDNWDASFRVDDMQVSANPIP